MPARRLPVRPDLDQVRHQAKDLLRAIRRHDADAIADLDRYHPKPPTPEHAKLADAQLVLARIYEAPNWARIVLSCKLIDAIWRDDVAVVRDLVRKAPYLLHESARAQKNDNWGPPLSYAANLGRDEIIAALFELGATDLAYAIDRAVLQSRIGTARLLHRMLGEPRPPAGAFGGAAYTLSVSGTEFLFSIGAELRDDQNNPDAPVAVVLQSDSRNPAAKHAILELYAAHGFALPDTPMMALHRGRLDLLDAHVQRDPELLRRTFTFAEIFPPELRCNQPAPGSYNEDLPRTPLAGSTLLHVCVEFDELEIARWLLEHGMDANAPAAVDANGFGGHTPLFGAIVSYPHFWMNFTGGWAGTQKPQQAAFATLLLDHGAAPNARASFREPLDADGNRAFRDHRDVTPLGWGDAFHNKMIVNEYAMRAVAARGGHR